MYYVKCYNVFKVSIVTVDCHLTIDDAERAAARLAYYNTDPDNLYYVDHE